MVTKYHSYLTSRLLQDEKKNTKQNFHNFILKYQCAIYSGSNNKFRTNYLLWRKSFNFFVKLALKLNSLVPWTGALVFKYRISSYKALPRIIPAFLIMPALGTLLCRWNLIISNNTCSWRKHKKIIPAGLIWGNTVCKNDFFFHL